jgi:hypothetical protein
MDGGGKGVVFGKDTPNFVANRIGVAGMIGTMNLMIEQGMKIDETDQSDSQTVTVCVGKDLTVSKTATPTFTRTFLWSITKDVDKTLVRQNSGNVTFNYTVVVNETGFTDSAWKVSET